MKLILLGIAFCRLLLDATPTQATELPAAGEEKLAAAACPECDPYPPPDCY